MRNLLVLLFLAISITACYEDTDNTFTEESIEIEQTNIETGLTGRVLDTDGSAVSNITLVVQDQVYNNDNNFFYHHLDAARKLGQLIYILKGGETVGMANSLLIEDDINYVDLHILPEASIQDIPLSNTDINLSDNFKLSFDASTLVRNNGSPVSGNATISFSHLTEKKYLDQLGYYAFSLEGELLILYNAEIYYYELQDSEGNALSPSEQTVFSLELQSTQKSLLWLDEKQGIWTEIKSGDIDQAHQTRRTGYFMLAESTSAVYSEGTITKEDVPVSFLDFTWRDNSSDKSIGVKTTANGKWASVHMADTELSVDVISPCKDLIEEEDLDIAATNKLDYQIAVNDDENYISVNTKVINCEGTVESNPALTISNGTGQNFIYVFQEGEIDTWLPICTSEFEVGGYNIEDGNAGPIVDWSIHRTADITFLSDCAEFENGFSYIKIKEDEMIYPPFTVETELMKTLLSENQERFKVDFLGTESRMYEKEEVRRVFIHDPEFGDKGYQFDCNSTLDCGMEEFVVTHLDEEPGGWVRITFSGRFFMGTIEPRIAGYHEAEGVILTKR